MEMSRKRYSIWLKFARFLNKLKLDNEEYGKHPKYSSTGRTNGVRVFVL